MSGSVFFNPLLLLTNGSSISQYCDATKECADKELSLFKNLYCSGDQACSSSNIVANENHNVFCQGSLSCYQTTIETSGIDTDNSGNDDNSDKNEDKEERGKRPKFGFLGMQRRPWVLRITHQHEREHLLPWVSIVLWHNHVEIQTAIWSVSWNSRAPMPLWPIWTPLMDWELRRWIKWGWWY